MASEVLLRFLSHEQHKEWAKTRSITVIGGYTGKRYTVAHRNSRLAQRFGRICYAVDDAVVVHFHDRSVPPEEEVLSAMLVLQHREDWLRNEATCLGGNFRRVFKHPFGDMMDGVMDASLTTTIGMLAQALSQP